MLERAWQALTGGMLSWYQAKTFIEHASFVSSDGLHVIAGMLVWILIALALRRPLSSGVPLAWLLGILLFNEVIWRSVKGRHSKMPAPVRAAFFLPVKAKKDKDDD